MRCNYYPRCPEPDRTLGTGPHCDPSALTILLQDGGVDGLQVLVDKAWRSVRPKPGELVVNIGDTFMVRMVACALDLPDLDDVAFACRAPSIRVGMP
jgi:isopenicillin N synthase-like dioxygenase